MAASIETRLSSGDLQKKARWQYATGPFWCCGAEKGKCRGLASCPAPFARSTQRDIRRVFLLHPDSVIPGIDMVGFAGDAG